MRKLLCALPLLFALIALSGCSDGKESAPTEAAQESGTGVAVNEDFVEGNLYFLAYHELGHALVSELDLPVTGREEDAVDRIAIWMMTPESGDEQPDYLLDAMQGWFSFGDQTSLDEIAWWDEHGTDHQRGYQIACLLFGADPERYRDLATDVGLPPERQESCVWESQQNQAVWDRLLMPHIREENVASPTSAMAVSYDPTERHRAESDYLRKIGLLEHVASLMHDTYGLKSGIGVVAEECGEANAFWDAEGRKLVICYELVAEYKSIASTG